MKAYTVLQSVREATNIEAWLHRIPTNDYSRPAVCWPMSPAASASDASPDGDQLGWSGLDIPPTSWKARHSA